MSQIFQYDWRFCDIDDDHLIAGSFTFDNSSPEAADSGGIKPLPRPLSLAFPDIQAASAVDPEGLITQVAVGAPLGNELSPSVLAQAVPPSVAEIVVYPRQYIPPPAPLPGSGGGGSTGGGTSPPAGGGQAPSASAIPDWVIAAAQAYVAAHVDSSGVNMSDPYTAAMVHAVERDLNKLYTAAQGKTFVFLNGPLAYDSSPNELLQDLNNINVIFTTATLLGGGAQTNHNTAINSTILINPTQIQNQHYENLFHYANGISYTIFHELGHAVSDYTNYYVANGQTTVNAEAFANTYGYSLSALAHDGQTFPYPNSAELALHGGWLGL